MNDDMARLQRIFTDTHPFARDPKLLLNGLYNHSKVFNLCGATRFA
jgi:hypothetical protein